MKVSKVFQYFNTLSLIILFIEIVVLFSGIDLLPLILIGLCCGLIIFIRNSSEDFFSSSIEVSQTSAIVQFILISCLDIGLLGAMLVTGITPISEFIVNILNTDEFVRFGVYGVAFPTVFSYFMAWFWMDEKPVASLWYPFISPACFRVYFKFLFVSLCVGLFICMNWEIYYPWVSQFLVIF